MKNTKEIITSIISSNPKIIIDTVTAEGDVAFHINLKDCDLIKEDCSNSILCTRFFVNFIGEFLVRENIADFATILTGLNPALYQKMVCACSHNDFGMVLGQKLSIMAFQMHISLVQKILTEEFTRESERNLNSPKTSSHEDFDESKPNADGDFCSDNPGNKNKKDFDPESDQDMEV